MKKLTYSFPAKVAAVFMLAVSVLATIIFGMTTVFAYAASFYSLPSHIGSSGLALEYLLTHNYLDQESYDDLMNHQRLFIDYVFNARYSAIALAVVGVIAFLVLFIFLMCAAGRRSDENGTGIRLSLFDRIPFDVVLLAVAAAQLLLINCLITLSYSWTWHNSDMVLLFILMAAIGTVMLLLALWIFYTFAARAKVGGWWRNTLIFMALRLTWRVLKWAWGLLTRVIRGVWGFFARLFHAIGMKPRLALVSLGILFLLFLAQIWIGNGEKIGLLMLFVLYPVLFVVVMLGAWQFDTLKRAGEKLAAGELEHKVDTKKMYFDYRRLGENLNSIGVGLSAAVEQRMKSERLKTELITNVSHDIKTPLTSIVNYVDLLQKPHSEEEGQQYLDVLARQSDKLRRLTLDLVEASKASTGNLPTNLVPTNSAELINQAVAEYADRFDAGKLEPVVTMPEKPITVLADGRHLWRVLDNLFNNAVKYAQPGTRVYIDLKRMDGQAHISVKNISRDRLNVSSEELMERFVRGDASRHTEGSGLGLSIARSLTELMGGRFNILIDGDLFKAEISLKEV